MITLYHCDGARSFRPLWMLEEMGLPYELKMLPFPRGCSPGISRDQSARHHSLHGRRRDQNDGVLRHLLLPGTKYGPTPLVVGQDDPAYGAFLNWMYFSDATLTFPQTLVLRYSQLEPEDHGTRKWPVIMPNGSSAGCAPSRQRPRMPNLCAGRFTAADIVNGYALRLAGNIGLAKDFGPNVAAYSGPVAGTRGVQAGDCGKRKAGIEQNVTPRIRA